MLRSGVRGGRRVVEDRKEVLVRVLFTCSALFLGSLGCEGGRPMIEQARELLAAGADTAVDTLTDPEPLLSLIFG